MQFSQRLRELRKEQNLTQSQLSSLLNYSYTAIANYENGRNEPRMSDFIKLANILGVSTDYLLGNSDIKYLQEDSLWLEEVYKILKKSHISLTKADQIFIDFIYFNTKKTALQKNITQQNFNEIYSKIIKESSQYLLETILLLFQNKLYYNIIKRSIINELNI
ncbi:helix-turn-helix transcriptional regulator [Clostridium sp. MD294]|uniref:helix-turn-helix domain-containing protein n=1 Tax=Clostridium sp. MD294 TaxID=97138 RepID=UPI0002CB1BFC|nr:helix-turn-helix transcriptional regulator [Clostridium sp. MD294]NDO46862.1 helix-turn-helix transcriptional regulator [Clostridium sp. MD294]USF28695.1 hypothetical protein C820_000069 [Clostridium sp. MD294]